MYMTSEIVLLILATRSMLCSYASKMPLWYPWFLSASNSLERFANIISVGAPAVVFRRILVSFIHSTQHDGRTWRSSLALGRIGVPFFLDQKGKMPHRARSFSILFLGRGPLQIELHVFLATFKTNLTNENFEKELLL